jgi:hypothetical protein
LPRNIGFAVLLRVYKVRKRNCGTQKTQTWVTWTGFFQSQNPSRWLLRKQLSAAGSMRARDSSGRQVSLLNDEPSYYCSEQASYRSGHLLSHHYSTSRSSSSSPNTPELLRSDSYDSNSTSNDPISPLTPTAYDYTRSHTYASSQSAYDDYASEQVHRKRPSYPETLRSGSYEDESSSSAQMPERSGKRYPCRYRDSHGCEKTFTTSGHASRHSKIHTAEKAVQCTFHGCQKKFTRADNMKQHLETHYKDKSRSSGSHRSSTTSSSSSKKTHSHSSSKLASRSEGRHSHSHSQTTIEYEQYPATHATPLPSPGGNSGAWDLRGLNLPLMSRPNAARTPSSGLDALAMAVACQEGA